MRYRPVRFASTLAVPVLLAATAGFMSSPAAAQIVAPKASQATTATPGAATNAEVIISSENCPVQFSARRLGAGAPEKVRGGSPAADERGLLLHFHAWGKDHGIYQATVIVHGSAYRPHIDPVGSSGSGDLTQTFHLANAERDAKGDWKLTTDQVPLVKVIDIVSMRFADGTTWKQSENSSCRV